MVLLSLEICACLSQKQKYNQFVKMTNGKGVQHGLYSLPECCDSPVEIDRQMKTLGVLIHCINNCM